MPLWCQQIIIIHIDSEILGYSARKERAEAREYPRGHIHFSFHSNDYYAFSQKFIPGHKKKKQIGQRKKLGTVRFSPDSSGLFRWAVSIIYPPTTLSQGPTTVGWATRENVQTDKETQVFRVTRRRLGILMCNGKQKNHFPGRKCGSTERAGPDQPKRFAFLLFHGSNHAFPHARLDFN